MNILSNSEYNFGRALNALRMKKGFLYGLGVFVFLSGILHMFASNPLKIGNAIIVLFLITIWIVKWEGKTNRQVVLYGLMCSLVSVFLIVLSL